MSSNFFPYAGFLQFTISFGEPAVNLQKVDSMVADLNPHPHSLLVLPELWATGFAPQRIRTCPPQEGIMERARV